MSFKVGNKIIALKQLPPDDIGILRKSRASEMSTFVRCNNHSHTISLKKKVDMWYKEQNINLTKLSRGQQGMYRSLIQVANVKRRVRREMYIKRHQEVQEKLREKAAMERLKTQNLNQVLRSKKTKKRATRPKVVAAVHVPTLDVIEETTGRSPETLNNIKEEREEDEGVALGYRMDLDALRKDLLERESSGFLETPSGVSRSFTEKQQKQSEEKSIRAELANPYGEPLPAINKNHGDSQTRRQSMENAAPSKDDNSLITMVTEANRNVAQGLISPDSIPASSPKNKSPPASLNSKTPLPKIGQQQFNASAEEENKRAGDKPVDITKFHFQFRGNRIPQNVHIKQVKHVVKYRKNSNGSLQPSEFSVKPVEEDFKLPSKRERYNVNKALREEKEKSVGRQHKLDNFFSRMEALKLEMEAARTTTRQSVGTPKEAFEKQQQSTLGFHTTVYTQAQKLMTLTNLARANDEKSYLRNYRRQSEDEEVPDFTGRLAGRRMSSWGLPTLDQGAYLQ